MRGNFIPPPFPMGMPNPNPNGGGTMNGSYNNNNTGNPNNNNMNNNNNNMAPHTMGSQSPWIMPPMGMPMNAQFLQTLIGNHPTSPPGASMMLPAGHPNQQSWFGAGGPPPVSSPAGLASGFCAPAMTGQGMMFFGAPSSSSLPMVGPGGGGGGNPTFSLSSSPPASSSAMRSSPPLHPRSSPPPPPPPPSTSRLNSAAPLLSSSDHSHASPINTTTKPEVNPSSPAPLTLSEEVLYSLYCQYGVDLIRTGGMLVGVSPTVIYHASMLFHRFQHAVQTRYRSQYKKADTRSDLDTTLQGDTADASFSLLEGNKEHPVSPLHQKIEYVIPAHTLSPMSSGMFPLADLCAPLDYCVYHMLSSSDDIIFLAAACLFLSSKLIYNVAPLAVIVKVFLQLSFSRINMSGDYVISLCENRFHDYRKCILQAEVEVCQVLGFRAGYTECPYKYLLCYLEFLVDDNNNGVKDASSVSIASSSSSSSSSGSPSSWSHSAPYLSWLKQATAVLNDLPRMPAVVLRYGPSALAVYAISDTVPLTLQEEEQEALPVGWSNAFGVSPSLLKEISDAVAKERSLFRSTKEVTQLITQLRKPAYLDAKEKAKQDKAAAEAMKTSREQEQQQQESVHDKTENTERMDQSPSREADGTSLDAVLVGHSISPAPSTSVAASSSLFTSTTTAGAGAGAGAALATDLRSQKSITGPLSQDSQMPNEVAARIERTMASAHPHNEPPPISSSTSTHPIPAVGGGPTGTSHCAEQQADVTNSVPPIIVPPSPDGEHGTLHPIAVTTPDVATGKVMGLPDTSGKKEEAQGNNNNNNTKKSEEEVEEEEEDDILLRMRKRKERAQKNSSSAKVKTSGSSSSATAGAEGEASSAGNKTKNASGGATSRSHHNGSGNEHSSSGNGSNSHHGRYGGRRRSRSRSDSEESRRRLRHEDYSSRTRDRERDREDRSSHRSRHESATNSTSTANGKHVDRRDRERDRDASRSDGKYSSRRYDRKR